MFLPHFLPHPYPFPPHEPFKAQAAYAAGLSSMTDGLRWACLSASS
jgi:hypothetical protein